MPQSLDGLHKGDKVKVIKEFLDFSHYKIEAGRILTFKEYNYFPYDGGYRFQFEEGAIRLAEIDAANERVLNNFNEYFELVT
ncbi:MAG: DUF3601 domain-containing protein [Cyclobacteriaceae bacterium]|jgi:hypothetical protein|nr:DUF3601 domain-containing protein [Cyclobacteriaceae bacterium]